MEEAVKEIVEKHFENMLIDMAKDPRIKWEGGDMYPIEALALDFLKERIAENMVSFLEDVR